MLTMLPHSQNITLEQAMNARPWPPYHEKKPCTHCTGGWVGPTTSLDWCRKSSVHTKTEFPENTARCKSLYPRHSSTVTSALDGHQCLPSRPGHFNPRKESWYPLKTKAWVGKSAGLGVLENRRTFCPNQDLNPGPSRQWNRRYTDHTQPQNLTLQQAMKAQPWQLYPLEINLIFTVQETGWAPGPVWSGAINLVPTTGFNPQTLQSVASHYTCYTGLANKTLTRYTDHIR
jgi:hypothetical protein